jgi:hypothetical protein
MGRAGLVKQEVIKILARKSKQNEQSGRLNRVNGKRIGSSCSFIELGNGTAGSITIRAF